MNMKNQFYGLSEENKARALLSFQKELIWMNCLEIKLQEGSITDSKITESYIQ